MQFQDKDAAGGISLANQEADAAERAYELRIEAQMREIHDTLHARAVAVVDLLQVGISTALARTLVNDALYDTLRLGADQAQSGAMADRIAATERKS